MMGPRATWLARLTAVLAVVWAAPAAARSITDAERGFSFELPQDFRDFEAGAAAPRTLASFVRGVPGQGMFAILRVEGLGQPIPHDKLDPAELERAARDSSRGSGVELTRFAYGTLRWKQFDLDLVTTEAIDHGQRLIILGTQVPVTREAVQISLIGPVPEHARMGAELQAIITSFQASTNWVEGTAPSAPSAKRSERVGELVGLAAGIAAAGVIWHLLRRRAARGRG